MFRMPTSGSHSYVNLNFSKGWKLKRDQKSVTYDKTQCGFRELKDSHGAEWIFFLLKIENEFEYAAMRMRKIFKPKSNMIHPSQIRL